MRVVTLTTNHEKDGCLFVAKSLFVQSTDWIPAFAGMTMGCWRAGYFQGNDSDGVVFSSMGNGAVAVAVFAKV